MSEELTQLKERADTLGIKYHPNIGLESLKAKVNAAMTGEPAPAETADDADDVTDTADTPSPTAAPSPQRGETFQEMRARVVKEATALVRCRITCLNPAKAHLKGEVITVGNKFTGAISKFVAFGEATDNGYHIPKIIYDDLVTRQFNSIRSVKGPNGTFHPEQRLVREFAIEVLPALSQEELDKLARVQAMAAGQ